MPSNPLVQFPFLNAFNIVGGGWQLPEAKDCEEGSLFLLLKSQIDEDGTTGTILEAHIFDGNSWLCFQAPHINPRN